MNSSLSSSPNPESSVLDFVQSLQNMKKLQGQWAALGLSERAESLVQAADRIKAQEAKLVEVISVNENFDSAFVLKNQVEASRLNFLEASNAVIPSPFVPRPTGLISILLPSLFSFRVLAERLAPALMAGNGVYVLFEVGAEAVCELWKDLLDPAWPVVILRGGDDLGEILSAHPAIQGVSFYGVPERAEKVLKSVSGTWKKWQITGGFHNSALVLNDVNLGEVSQKLAQSCFVGMGQLHWNTSTILITETLLPDFQKSFVEVLESMKFEPVSESVQARLKSLRAQLVSEKAKFIFDGGEGKPFVVQDLSHCSTLQQDCLQAPVVLISPVKYVHEMVKWTNTSYFGMSAQIFGADEKVSKFGGQLDVSQVFGNCWIENSAELPLGIKQSFSGIADLSPFGSFFSDQRKIDGTLPKK